MKAEFARTTDGAHLPFITFLFNKFNWNSLLDVIVEYNQIVIYVSLYIVLGVHARSSAFLYIKKLKLVVFLELYKKFIGARTIL